VPSQADEAVCEQSLSGSYSEAIRELAVGYLNLEQMVIDGSASRAAISQLEAALNDKKTSLIKLVGLKSFESEFAKYLAAESKIKTDHNNLVHENRADSRTKEKVLLPPSLLHKFTVAEGRIYSTDVSADGQYLATGFHSGLTILWNLSTGAEVHRFKSGAEIGSIPVAAVAFSPDSQQLAASYRDGRVQVWSVKSNERVRSFNPHKTWAPKIQFSPDGRFILTCAFDGAAVISKVKSGEKFRTFKIDPMSTCRSARFSRNGQFIAAGFVDGNVHVWNVQTSELVRILEGDNSEVIGLDFSLNGAEIMVTTVESRVSIWNIWPGEKVRELQSPAEVSAGAQTGFEILAGARYSPDGQYVITASEDHEAIIWNSKTGEKISELQSPQDAMQSVVFGADSKSVAISGRETTTVWRIEALSEELN
jgi:WD40 repeat protein